MLRNYFTVAVRGLFRNKLYSIINIFGLAVGLASCLLILMFVRDELSYDAWIPNADRIYQVNTRFDIPGRNPMFAIASPGPVKAALEKDFTAIETAVTLVESRPVIQKGNDVFYDEVVLTDSTFFDVFELPLTAGEKATALSDKTAILLSESMAKKYFGTASPLGEVLTMTFNYGARDMRVTGVFKDLPHNTHLKIDFLAALNREEFAKMPWVLDSWTSVNSYNYIKLKPGTDIAPIRADLSAFEARNIPDTSIGGRDFKTADFLELTLVNLTDVHLKSKGLGGFKDKGDATVVTTFSAVALMILLIACINFTNLATARASLRAREVALRKVLGAHRGQLIVQFLGESVLLSVVALAVALALVAAVLPMYGDFLDRKLSLSFADAGLWASMAGLVLLVGVVGGFYPALYLSRFSPARILKANKSAASQGSGRLRGALVVVQFAISIGLIVCTAVVYGQTQYMRTMDIGFNKTGLLAISGLRRDAVKDMSDTLRDEFMRIPGVAAVTRANEAPADGDESNNVIEIPGQVSTQPLVIGMMSVDYNFFDVFQIPVIAGRALSQEFGADDMNGKPEELAERGGNAVINRHALKLLGLTNPADAVGRQVSMGVGGEGSTQRMLVTIVGVVENVRYDTARAEIRPIMFRYRTRDFNYAFLRVKGVEPGQINDAAGRIWRDLAPSQPYNAEFIETKLSNQYNADEARGQMFAAFAGLAVIIACLGLYGLASFTADRRTKEIGIRKVLGAKVRDIVRILAWDFSKPVLVANIIAWPAAWWLMRDWLNSFETQIALSPVVFVAAGLGALAIALATVALHTMRVARANPIHALRYE
ncbi:MAG: ABC transporter permease [Rhodospirillaceae bacterium]|nr:ABC transporter permease [Rhodospirillaceae bacterium]